MQMMVNDYYNEKFVGVELKRMHDKNPCHTTILYTIFSIEKILVGYRFLLAFAKRYVRQRL